MRYAVVLMDGYGNILCELQKSGSDENASGFYSLPQEYRDGFCTLFAIGDTWTVECVEVED